MEACERARVLCYLANLEDDSWKLQHHSFLHSVLQVLRPLLVSFLCSALTSVPTSRLTMGQERKKNEDELEPSVKVQVTTKVDNRSQVTAIHSPSASASPTRSPTPRRCTPQPQSPSASARNRAGAGGTSRGRDEDEPDHEEAGKRRRKSDRSAELILAKAKTCRPTRYRSAAPAHDNVRTRRPTGDQAAPAPSQRQERAPKRCQTIDRKDLMEPLSGLRACLLLYRTSGRD